MEPRYPEGTPEYEAYAAELREELRKFSLGEPPYDTWQPEPEHNFIPGGPKDETGQLNPSPSCACGATMPEGIKTTPHGWYTGHTKYGWS